MIIDDGIELCDRNDVNNVTSISGAVFGAAWLPVSNIAVAELETSEVLVVVFGYGGTENWDRIDGLADGLTAVESKVDIVPFEPKAVLIDVKRCSAAVFNMLVIKPEII